MDAAQEYESLRDAHEAAKIRFIVTELDLALTFCKIASSADNDDLARRNMTKARKAYDSATRFFAGATMASQIRKDIDNKIERLRSLLPDLGGAS
jgi:hypothetical protein